MPRTPRASLCNRWRVAEAELRHRLTATREPCYPPSMSSPPLEIRIADAAETAVRAFLDDHLSEMRRVTPEGSVYAMTGDRAAEADVTMWAAWRDGEIVGCGALRELDPSHGEIKSMRTAPAHRRSGVAAALLSHILRAARSRGYTRVSLETGASPAFDAARRLYEREGFKTCEAFGDYGPDPHSYFMSRPLP